MEYSSNIQHPTPRVLPSSIGVDIDKLCAAPHTQQAKVREVIPKAPQPPFPHIPVFLLVSDSDTAFRISSTVFDSVCVQAVAYLWL